MKDQESVTENNQQPMSPSGRVWPFSDLRSVCRGGGHVDASVVLRVLWSNFVACAHNAPPPSPSLLFPSSSLLSLPLPFTPQPSSPFPSILVHCDLPSSLHPSMSLPSLPSTSLPILSNLPSCLSPRSVHLVPPFPRVSSFH